MTETTHRSIKTYRWICTNKERCNEIDDKLKELEHHESRLSGYVANGEISGLACISLARKFTLKIKDLRDERKTYWRRVRYEVEEEIVKDITQAEAEPQPKYESPFAPLNMERVL